jgi:[histone H3]-lysine4 N-trimethyltransferase ATXR3
MQLLLNALNKQVRHFTGLGNTPMTYNIRPVIEEIQRSAEDSGDRRTLKMCLGMLKSMRNRSDQNFVAYRKVSLQQPINSGSFLVSF